MDAEAGFTPCRNCYGRNGIYQPGYIWHPFDPETKHQAYVEECSCHRAWRERRELAIRIKAAGCREDIIDYCVSSYAGTKSLESVKRLTAFAERYASDDRLKKVILYMYGPNGTQKTQLGSWLARELIRSGASVKYMLMNNLARMLMKGYGFGASDGLLRELESIESKDMLIIDEAFDKEKMIIYDSSRSQIAMLDSFIRDRIAGGKGMVFISNVHPSQIAANKFSQSVQDLIMRETAKYNSVLTFEDNYMQLKNSINVEELF